MGKAILVVSVLLAACGGEDAPSCQQAVAHFYAAGCVFADQTNGRQYTEGEFATLCRSLLADAPSQCQDDLADWRSCLGSVTSPAKSNADCDCSAEQEAILTCE